MIRSLLTLVVLLAASLAGRAQTLEFFATTVEPQDVWTNETNAQGSAMPPCLDNAVNYAINPAGSDTHFLRATAFQPFALPPGKVISGVSADVLCRFDNNGHSGAVDVRVLWSGIELTTATRSFFNNSNVTDCRWLSVISGSIPLSADWVHNPDLVNTLDVLVRRSTATPQNQTMLKVKALKIVVTLTDDSDGDTFANASDNCPSTYNPDQTNSDSDSLGNACDNCDFISNQAQTDSDFDGAGNECDNCPGLYNWPQTNSDTDTLGDACDNCDFTSNQNQANQDGDAFGDLCDPCPPTVACDCNLNGIPDATDRIQHPEWDQNNDGALDQCLPPIAFADLMLSTYPDGEIMQLQSNDVGRNSKLNPTNQRTLPPGSPPALYPSTPNEIIIVTGPQHGDCITEPGQTYVHTWYDPSPDYVCGPDTIQYQVVDALGVPSLPVWVTVSTSASGEAFDCNANGQYDPDEIANGWSSDCNYDSIPDECQCQLDADNNGVIDLCETGATRYCFGYQTIGNCPCGNFSSTNSLQGCKNSLGGGGALTPSGAVSLAADTAVLQASGMPVGSSGLYFQGANWISNGNGTPFGDGKICVSGSIQRLAVVTATNGSSRYPAVGGTPLSQVGGVTAPGARFYQLWYRDSASFCTSSLFNLTGAVRLIWRL